VQAKAKFAGEQQITTAILALTQEKKPKVVFVRPGGGPLTSPASRRSSRRVRSRRWRTGCVTTTSKCSRRILSGTWAMQAQMRQQPAEPEPSDEDIKDAVWVVLSIPAGNGPMGPTPPIAPKVAETPQTGRQRADALLLAG
jgi:hypothetical protein